LLFVLIVRHAVTVSLKVGARASALLRLPTGLLIERLLTLSCNPQRR
jgi:hypothetical protein